MKSGFVTQVKNKWPHVTSSHCSLHRCTLASKFSSTFDGSYGRCGQSDQLYLFEGKNHRLFRLLAKEMGAQHVGLFVFTKVRWLPRCKCLSQLYELKNEVKTFLREKTKTTFMSNFTMKNL